MERACSFALMGLMLCGPRPASGAEADRELFAHDRLVQVRIEISPVNWERLRRQTRAPGAGYATETFGPAPESPFSWFPAKVTVDGRRFAGAGVRKKGFLGSLDEHRPSLRVDLGRVNKQVRLQGLRKLVLNNGREGPALFRQCLAYRVFTAAGYPASRCGFARVWVNGADLGAYVLLEPVNKRFLRRTLGKTPVALFEGTGSDFRPRWINTFEAKNKAAGKQVQALADLAAALEAPDDRLLQSLDEHLDLNAFLSFWALETLVGHLDGYAASANNFYVYRLAGDGRLRFLPWGMDKVMAYPDRVSPTAMLTFYSGSKLTVRLARVPGARARYRKRLISLIDRVWSPQALVAELHAMEAVVLPAMLPAQRKAYRYMRDNLIDFLRRRGQVLKAELARSDAEPIRDLLPPPTWRARLPRGKPAQRQGPR